MIHRRVSVHPETPRGVMRFSNAQTEQMNIGRASPVGSTGPDQIDSMIPFKVFEGRMASSVFWESGR